MKILWLKTEVLHPMDKGGKIRSYETLKHLKRSNQVTYLCFRRTEDSRESIEQSSAYADRLLTVPLHSTQRYSAAFYLDLSANLASPLPYSIQKYRSDEMRRAISHTIRQDGYDLIISDFLTPCVNLAGRTRTPSILFQHNVESQIWERYYQNAPNPVRRAYFYSQFRKMARFEGRCLRQFDAIIAVSEADRQTMSSRFGTGNIHCVPTGVDTSYFAPAAGARLNRSELVFTGSMDYMPNEDAIIYFVDSVLPKIASRVIDVSLTVVGRNPGPRLLALSKSNPRVNVTGSVPDVRPYLERAACFVVPIRIGGGTRLKIFEAMSMARPVVSTTVGAEGLPVTNGDHLLIADDPQDFAERVIEVLKDAEHARAIGDRARLLVAREFGWDCAAGRFAKICEDIVSRLRASRAA